MKVIKGPLTVPEIRELVNQDNLLAVVVPVPFSEIASCEGMDRFNDLVDFRVVPHTVGLEGVSYTPVGCDPETKVVFVLVEGNASAILNEDEYLRDDEDEDEDDDDDDGDEGQDEAKALYSFVIAIERCPQCDADLTAQDAVKVTASKGATSGGDLTMLASANPPDYDVTEDEVSEEEEVGTSLILDTLSVTARCLQCDSVIPIIPRLERG